MTDTACQNIICAKAANPSFSEIRDRAKIRTTFKNKNFSLLYCGFMLKAGDKAPDFELKDTDGNKVNLSSMKGGYVALYFYPKDDTPGCTKQACNIRDNYAGLKGKVKVFGISLDDEKSHKKFTEKFNLNFPLLCDTEKEVSRKYGVYRKKQFMGKEFMGIVRSTFVVGKDGKIKGIIEDVDVEYHAQQILESLKR